MAKKAAVKEKPEGNETGDSPVLDLTDADVKKFIKSAKARGFVTYDQLNKVLPSDEVSSEQIEDIMAQLSEMGINVVEHEEEEEDEEAPRPNRKRLPLSQGREKRQQRCHDEYRRFR